MKVLVVLCALVAMSLGQQTYDSRFDNFNAQELVGNERLLKAYGLCFIEKGPCTSEGLDIRKVIPEAIQTSCSKCTLKQRELVRVIVHAFQNKLKDLWEKILDKYDPKREYAAEFEKFINSQE